MCLRDTMIWESCYWKDPLLDLVKQIESWESATTLDEPDFAEIERQLMTGFYSVRRLVEAKKLSDSVAQEKLNCKSFPNLKTVNLLNWHHYEKLYDLGSPTEEKLEIGFVFNQFIHSYVFIIADSESCSFEGVYFCSDRYRNKNLFYISTSEIKRIFYLVGANYPYKSKQQYNPKTKDYDLTQA